MSRTARGALIGAAGLAAILSASGANAFSTRGGGNGDSYIDDLQKRPELLEPYRYNDPSRYRIGNPRAGYEDRQIAREGYVNEGSGYDGPRTRGRVVVRPYYAR
ncbi:MAG: hypothetical protein JWR08_2176 [Enterovirga sp.]|jgi:hypothetical protein|nr:hypothetical protein [Enterovirga sp.]